MARKKKGRMPYGVKVDRAGNYVGLSMVQQGRSAFSDPEPDLTYRLTPDEADEVAVQLIRYALECRCEKSGSCKA